MPQIAPDAVQMTRNAGFMLAEQATDFGERLFLGIIEAKPVLFLWGKVIESGLQSAGKEGDVASPMRVDRVSRRVMLCAQSSIGGFIFSKLFEAPARTDGINMTLGKNSAKPGL